jgi:hypothetical protein
VARWAAVASTEAVKKKVEDNGLEPMTFWLPG